MLIRAPARPATTAIPVTLARSSVTGLLAVLPLFETTTLNVPPVSTAAGACTDSAVSVHPEQRGDAITSVAWTPPMLTVVALPRLAPLIVRRISTPAGFGVRLVIVGTGPGSVSVLTV